MKTTKYILTLVLAFWSAMGNLYAVEKSYYNSIDGKSGSTLREALTTLTYTKHTTDVGYNWTFDGIDIVNGEVLDIYSTCTWTAAQQGKNYTDICDGYNREHLVPQSVFEEKTPQRSDRHHLFLTDGKVNQIRSSYPFGETDATDGFSDLSNANKALGQFGVAASGYTGNVYEPADEYKGDVARAVLYMVIRYATSDVCKTYGGSANAYPVTTWSNAMFSSSLSTNYGLSDKAKAVFLAWHRADPVSAKEVARNNGVEAKQGNRNPFIDLPDLVEYLWGNHAGETVNLSGLTIATGGGSVPTPYELTLNRHGVTQTLTCTGTYTLPTASTEENACDGWEFKGWTTSSSYNNTTAPTYTASVSSAATLYAVYGNTSSSAPSRAKMASATYDKVTSTEGITDGQYLIVYETGNVAFDGSLETLDATSNTVSVTISGSSITGDFAANEFTIDVSEGTIQSASGYYIGQTGNSNGLLASTSTAYTNTLTISDGNIDACSSGGAYLRYNATSGQDRFRYFKSSSYTNQQAIQLYKKSSGGGSTTTYKTSPDCGSLSTITLSNSGVVTGGDFMANVSSAYPGATITLTADPDPGYEFGSWSVTKQGGGSVTVTNNQFTMPDANVTVSATFNALTRYNIRFFNNGSQIGSTQSVYVGGTPNIPADPECDGYTFVGWHTSSLAANNTTSHTWVTDFTVSAAQDYYAIFSKTEGGGGSSTVTFAKSDFSGSGTISASKSGVSVSCVGNIPSGAYVTFTENNTLTISSTSGNITAIDFTCSADDYTGNMTDVSDISTTSWSITVNNPGNKTTVRVSSIVVTIGSSGTTYYTSTTSCASACTTLATPVVTATPGNGQITLTWSAVEDADHYTVTISSGAGYTTECGSAASIGEVTGTTTKTCVITGLTNGLEYTTTVVANATSATCDSEADTDTATPQDCTPWADPTLSWNKYSLNTTTNKTATKTLSGTTHGTLSFESSNTDVLTVNSSTGAVTAVGAGEATVTAHWTAASGYCEKTMTSSTFEVAGPLTISFDANGGTGTMSAQTVTYKAAAAIKANTFTRTGYTFQGWALTADGEKTYDDKQSVAFTNSLTLYAVWQLNSHNVSFSSPAGATVTVNNQSSSPQSVAYGSTVTVRITPAEHYTITSVAVSGTSGNVALTGTGETRTFTMPDENVTVTVSMEAESQYTATFYNGTASFATVNGYVDDDINAPVGTPASCDDDEFTFIGWVAAEQTEETTSMPSVLTFPQTMPTGGVSYYALFRRSEGGGGGEASVTFNTAASDGNTAYTDDSGIKANLVASSSGIASFEGDRLYVGTSGVKLGSSNNVGYITLTLSSAITTDKITVIASKYGTDTGDLEIEVNGSTAFGEAKSPEDGTLEFTGDETQISSLTISTTSKRAYIASISLGGGGTSYYTTAPACIPCENQVTLTKGAESNGTFTLDKANGTYDNCKKNFSVTVSGITPATDYYCTGVTATGNSMYVAVNGPDGSGNYTVAYAKGHSITSTITANFAPIPTYTVTWSIDGDESRTEEYKEGDAIDFSYEPDDCSSGKKFMGWSAVEVDEQDEAPAYVTSATMATSPITYYAVFAEETTGSGGSSTLLEYDGSGSATLTDIDGVTANGLGSDYAANNAPYLLKFDGTGDYIQFALSSVPSALTFAYKMIGGANTSTMTIKQCATADGSYTDVQAFSISGSQNSTGSFTTTNAFSQQFVRMVFTKGSNVGVGAITITGSGSSTTYSGYTTSCEVPTNVTVTFNANGGTGTMTDQSISYNTPTLLKPNEFTREGYVFQGWATTADGSVAYDDKGLVTFKRRTTTLYAVWAINSYTITLVQPSGGTVNTSPAATAEYGEIVTVVVTPDSHHTFGSITVTKNSGGTVSLSGSGVTQTFTMPADNVTVTASLNVIPTYTVTWSADGDETNQAQYIEGESIVFPATAEGCEGKTFVGWSATQFAETDDAPALVTSAVMGTSNLIYYAVYADASSGGGSTTETYGFEDADNATNWTIEGPAKNDTYAATGTYSGKINTANTYITYKNKVKVTNFSFKFKRGSDNNNYNVYVETSTDGSAWTAVETYAMNTFAYSGSTFTAKSKDFDGVTDLYVRFHCYNTTAVRYVDDISITYGGGVSYSGYTTSCGASIGAKSGKWLTAAKGQKVKTAIEVKARGFAETVTLSANSSNSHFSVALAETDVPVAGLTTTLTVEYTPASANVTENATITLTAGDVTKTITVNARSLPDEFLIITKKGSDWKALPANMSSGLGEYDGVDVTPDNTTTPTSVATSPSTLVYSLKSVANERYADAGSSVRLVGNNNYCLYGAIVTPGLGIQNSQKFAETNTENTDWLLTTEDGVSYAIANPNHADYAAGRRLAYGAKFGQYNEETVFYFVTTSGCNSKPDNVQVKPRRSDVTFSWVSNATEMHIDVYKNAEMTGTPFKSETATASPHYMSGLTQEADYWYKLTPDTDTDCAVTGTFSTAGPTIDIVEWMDNDSVIILVDKDPNLKPNIVIEGEVEHGVGTGATATELFFSKYFEGAGSMKLVSIFNGTTGDINLANYSIFVRMRGSSGTWSGSSNDVTLNLSSLGSIKSGQEIIFFSRPLDTETALASCSNTFLNDKVTNNSSADSNPRWVECDGTTYKRINFNGNDPIMLKKSGTTIDIIGSEGTAPTTQNCLSGNSEKGWAGTVKNMDKGKSPSDPAFDAFYEASSKTPATTQDSINLLAGFGINLTADEISITTARCILFRDNRVTSGDSAMLVNGTTFVTFTNHDAFKSEWTGRAVCMDDAMRTAAGVSDDSQATCNSYHDLGTFNYSEYYKDWNTIADKDPSLDSKIIGGGSTSDAENYYRLYIENMAQYSCLNLKFNLVDKDDPTTIYASKEAQVPILVKGTHSTNDPIFNQIVKTDGGDAVIDQSIERCKTCEVRILDGATLTKAPNNTENDATEVGNLTIYPGGKLEVPTGRTFTVSTLTYRVENEGSEPEADLQGDLLMKSSTLTVTRRIKNDRYYFFSLPYDCNLSDVHWANSNTPVELNTDYMILEYDGETRAAEGSYIYGTPYWKPIEGDVIKAGKGYNIAVSSSKIKELVFPMAVDDGENNTKTNLTTAEAKKQTGITVGLDEYVGVYTTLDDNWNLIAHPYLTKFTAKPATTIEAWTTQTRSFDPNNDTYAGYLDYGTWNESITWGLAKEEQFEVNGRGAIPSCTSMSDFPWNKYRTAISYLKISGDITDIGTYAFAQCKRLKQVTLAATVTNIGNQAFSGCSQLRYIEIVNPMIISVNEAAFQGVDLRAITLTVPEQSADEYRNHSVWGQMNIKAAENGTSGDGTTHGNSPRRANEQDHYSTVGNGLYITMPEISASGVVTYVPKHVDGLTAFDIKPFSAVFIQGAGKGSVTFKGSGSGAPKRSPWLADNRMEDESVFVGVNISGNGESDLTSLRLRPDYREGYKPTLDLVKSTTYYTERPQLYMITDAGRLSFRAVSDLIAEHCWLPMGIYCRDAGNYTFSLYDRYPLDQVEAVYLRDNVTGTETNLMLGNYTITTDKQLYTNTRFEVRVVLRREIEVDTPTMIDHTEDPNAPRKFFRDGLLYILREGKVYDMTGKPVEFDDLLNR